MSDNRATIFHAPPPRSHSPPSPTYRFRPFILAFLAIVVIPLLGLSCNFLIAGPLSVAPWGWLASGDTHAQSHTTHEVSSLTICPNIEFCVSVLEGVKQSLAKLPVTMYPTNDKFEQQPPGTFMPKLPLDIARNAESENSQLEESINLSLTQLTASWELEKRKTEALLAEVKQNGSGGIWPWLQSFFQQSDEFRLILMIEDLIKTSITDDKTLRNHIPQLQPLMEKLNQLIPSVCRLAGHYDDQVRAVRRDYSRSNFVPGTSSDNKKIIALPADDLHLVANALEVVCDLAKQDRTRLKRLFDSAENKNKDFSKRRNKLMRTTGDLLPLRGLGKQKLLDLVENWQEVTERNYSSVYVV